MKPLVLRCTADKRPARGRKFVKTIEEEAPTVRGAFDFLERERAQIRP